MPTPVKKVMISSTARDLPEHRQKVEEACKRLQMFQADMMEHLTAEDADALEVSLRIVDSADLYIGLFAYRYGYVPEGQSISVTEAEYDRAATRKIPRLIFLMSEKHQVSPATVETGDGAVKLTKLKERLQKNHVVAFFDSPSDLGEKVIQALLPYRDTATSSTPAAEPLIHTLPTQQEIEGRDAESLAVLRAMSAGEDQVYVFTAPGGFGKTALLAKVVKTLAPDDVTLLDRIELTTGDKLEPHVSALLHVDCRREVKVSELFSNSGRLIGEEQTFDAIYNSDAELPDKLQEIFRRLSRDSQKRVWFVFDNFESMLAESREVGAVDLRVFFSAIFAGGHRVRALIASREVPKFSKRERAEVLEAIGEKLFDGLPVDDCVEFLKKNGGTRRLTGLTEAVDSVLREFADRVHHIPLALVWAVGYLQDTNFTLKEMLSRADLFADFDKDQGQDADRYENKGVKRLHYEQLKLQPPEFVPLLQLLAFFKRPVPLGVLAHLMDEIELSKTLTRLERNRLITRKESPDGHTRFLNDPLAVNLYGLHPLICENEFFTAQPDQESVFETAAGACGRAASTAFDINRFWYELEVTDCAERLYDWLNSEYKRDDLQSNKASMLISKGNALAGLTKLNEALVEYDQAIAIGERLVTEERQAHLASDLAMAYMNKAVSLRILMKLHEALVEYDKAITIYERLVMEEQQAHLAGDLAMAYLNKGNALADLRKLNEALREYGEAIVIYERLVREAQQAHLANDLAIAYMNKGTALDELSKFNEALAEYDKAIAIYERLVSEERQAHLSNALATIYMNKGNALCSLKKLNEALAEYDKAIAIRECLVNEEQQAHLSNALAMAYVNKGNALSDLPKLNEALREYDKAIAVYERLVNEEQQVHLANALATAYLNKGTLLKKQHNRERAIVFYEKSVSVRRGCVDASNMYWIVPDLLTTIRYWVRTLFDLERWPEAALGVSEFLSRHDAHLKNDSIDHSLKEAAAAERVGLVSVVRGLSPEQRELLYAELSDEADSLKALVEM